MCYNYLLLSCVYTISIRCSSLTFSNESNIALHANTIRRNMNISEYHTYQLHIKRCDFGIKTFGVVYQDTSRALTLTST